MDPIVSTALHIAISEGIKYLARLSEAQELLKDGQISEDEALVMLQSAQIRFDGTRKRWDEAMRRRATFMAAAGAKP